MAKVEINLEQDFQEPYWVVDGVKKPFPLSLSYLDILRLALQKQDVPPNQREPRFKSVWMSVRKGHKHEKADLDVVLNQIESMLEKGMGHVWGRGVVIHYLDQRNNSGCFTTSSDAIYRQLVKKGKVVPKTLYEKCILAEELFNS